jgi:DNA processing protein
VAALTRSDPATPAGPAPVAPPGAELRALLEALALPGIGGVRLRTAIRRAGGVEAACRELSDSVGPGLREAERARAAGWAERAYRTVLSDGIHVLLPGGAAYPAELEHADPAPFPLFGMGRLGLLETPMVAVVGTRACTRYGRQAAHRIAAGLAAAGVTVVSGLARGIDGVAHRAAGARRTIAVVGSGVDVTFPRQHRALQAAIARDGLVLSEQLPGTPPVGHNFPRRNRIIAGLARAVVVVEAPARSGALSTASHAREMGRDVFAVPGPVGSRASEGTNALIRDGARLVTGAREVLEELGLPADGSEPGPQVAPEGLNGMALALWRAMDEEPRHVDQLASRAGLDPHRSLASLLALELEGHARQRPGLRFARS